METVANFGASISGWEEEEKKKRVTNLEVSCGAQKLQPASQMAFETCSFALVMLMFLQ